MTDYTLELETIIDPLSESEFLGLFYDIDRETNRYTAFQINFEGDARTQGDGIGERLGLGLREDQGMKF